MSHRTFVHTHRVTYAECTLGNHVYYSRFLDILEAARGEFFRQIGVPFKQLHESDTLFPVIEARLRYRGAARYDDILRIEVWLTEMERVRVGFSYRVLNDSPKAIIEASTLHACSSSSDRLKRLPEGLLVLLEPYLARLE